MFTTIRYDEGSENQELSISLQKRKRVHLIKILKQLD